MADIKDSFKQVIKDVQNALSGNEDVTSTSQNPVTSKDAGTNRNSNLSDQQIDNQIATESMEGKHSISQNEVEQAFQNDQAMDR